MAGRDSQSSSDLRFKSVQLFKEASLGAGSYGTVCRVKCDDLMCAAKILRLDAFPSKDEGFSKLISQECELLGAIRHPNIVQYLGTWRDPSTNLPVLLMELMDRNLTQYLENSPQSPLPFHMEVNICHDISLALAFLHSNDIIHRDLSSNNVLMIGDRRAKVTDFGMARLWDANLKSPQSSLSQRPGCEAYMSPEANSGSYTTKLDCFSIGVLTIQILTNTFPQPGNQFKVVHISDPNFPNGIEARAPEVERRKNHINLIPPEHPLRPMALDCIKDREKDRPSSHDLCCLLAGVKETPRYTNSTDKSSADRLIEDIERQVMGLQEMSLPSLDGDVFEDQLRYTVTSKKSPPSQEGVVTEQNHVATPSQGQVEKHVAETSRVDTPTQDQQVDTPSPQGSGEREATPTQEGMDQQVDTPSPQGSGEREATPTQEDSDKHEATPTQEDLNKHEPTPTQQGSEAPEQNLPSQEELNQLSEVQARKIQVLQLKIKDLQSKELVANQEIENLRSNLASMERQLEEKQSQLQTNTGQDPQLQEKVKELEKGLQRKKHDISTFTASTGPMELKRVKLDWEKETKTPRLMSRTCNSIATTEKMVYLRPGASAEVYSYNIEENLWSKFPDCPFIECGLAIIKRKLTIIGGKKESQFSNKLLSLVETVGRKEWIVIYPPMSIKRCSAATLHCNNLLIVAGGEGEDGYLKTVEVLNINTSTWQVVASLPESLVFSSATYTGQQIFLLGGWVEKMTPTYSTFTVSLDSLLKSSSEATLEEEHATSPWHELTKLPLKGSSCVSVNGRLLSIGGRDIHKPTSVVHIYNPLTNSWEVLTHMGHSRHQCFVAALGNKLLVIGGWELNKKQMMSETNTVEIATVLS